MSERSLFAPPLRTSDTEVLDALFLELGQFVKVRSRREMIMIQALIKIVENVDDAQKIATQALNQVNYS